jgi:hypothetical protein
MTSNDPLKYFSIAYHPSHISLCQVLCWLNPPHPFCTRDFQTWSVKIFSVQSFKIQKWGNRSLILVFVGTNDDLNRSPMIFWFRLIMIIFKIFEVSGFSGSWQLASCYSSENGWTLHSGTKKTGDE